MGRARWLDRLTRAIEVPGEVSPIRGGSGHWTYAPKGRFARAMSAERVLRVRSPSAEIEVQTSGSRGRRPKHARALRRIFSPPPLFHPGRARKPHPRSRPFSTDNDGEDIEHVCNPPGLLVPPGPRRADDRVIDTGVLDVGARRPCPRLPGPVHDRPCPRFPDPVRDHPVRTAVTAGASV